MIRRIALLEQLRALPQGQPGGAADDGRERVGRQAAKQLGLFKRPPAALSPISRASAWKPANPSTWPNRATTRFRSPSWTIGGHSPPCLILRKDGPVDGPHIEPELLPLTGDSRRPQHAGESCAHRPRHRDCWWTSLSGVAYPIDLPSRTAASPPIRRGQVDGDPPAAGTSRARSASAFRAGAAPARTPQPSSAHDHHGPAVAERDAPRVQPPAQVSPPSPQTIAQAPARPAQPTAALPGGDPQAGRLVYRKCQACHSLEPGKNTLGPSLAGIFGKKAGEVPNFNYSPALKASNIVWDVAALDAYLLDPQKAVPGNKMPFPGLKTENERRDVIAYLAGGSPAGAAAGRAAPAAAARRRRAPGAPGQPAAAPPRQPAASADRPSVSYLPDVRYTLRSGIAEGRMVYLGVGGTIDGQVNPLLVGRGRPGRSDHPHQRRRRGARHRLSRAGCEIAPHHRARRKHQRRVPRHARRRLYVYLQRARPPARRHAGAIRGDAAAAGPGGRRGGHLAEIDRCSAADRQSCAANGARRSCRGRTRRPARRGHDLRLLDLQRQGARAPCCACASATRSMSMSRIQPTAA